MIVRTLDEATGSPREVLTQSWVSRRLLLRDDGMGFSLHDTIVRAGTTNPMEYRHHLEAVYCIEGHGHVTLPDTGEVFPIRPGTVYALDRHDAHVLTAVSDLRVICVFNPPLVGPEVHDETGAYPAEVA